jgi:hypothetical protein
MWKRRNDVSSRQALFRQDNSATARNLTTPTARAAHGHSSPESIQTSPPQPDRRWAHSDRTTRTSGLSLLRPLTQPSRRHWRCLPRIWPSGTRPSCLAPLYKTDLIRETLRFIRSCGNLGTRDGGRTQAGQRLGNLRRTGGRSCKVRCAAKCGNFSGEACISSVCEDLKKVHIQARFKFPKVL